MPCSDAPGYSLIEMVIVVLLLGLLLVAGAVGLARFNDDLALKGATAQMTGALRLTRERAVTTRTARTMRFQAGVSGTDYRVEVAGVVQAGWKLPRRVTYESLPGTINSVTITPDGRCSTSGLIILRTTGGLRDTVGILASGLVVK